jgi:IS30 family transposase
VTNDEALIAAWHSKQSLREVAEEFGVSQHVVEREWRRLKYVGRLPQAKRDIGGRRPPMSEHEPSLPPLWSDDPLLDKLREVHGDSRCDFYSGMRSR